MAAQVAILSGPGIGHLFPCSELARRLVRHHNLTVTLITQSLSPPSNTELSLITSIREEINVISIPPPPPHSIPQNKNLIFLLFFLSTHSCPHLRTILNSLTANTNTPPLKALLVDMFYDEATLDIAQELGVGHYMFFTSPCILLSFALHLPKLDETYDGEYIDMLEPIKLPGYSQSFYGKDFPQPVVERKTEVYTSYLNLSKLYYKTHGILVNSTEELEPELIKFMKEDKRIPPVYPTGLVIRSCSSDEGGGASDHQCLKWLEEQPKGSVLYVSFGSGGALTGDQLKELACGLELSKQRFLWVVKRPNDELAHASYFGAQINMSSFDFLPTGFLDRTKRLGLVVPAWAPQVQVLGHAAIGGFLTHCGWNSILESISNGVPMIAWPLFAEQKMTAVMLEEDMKVAVRAKVDDTGLVRREEVVRLIKCLMEEEQGRKMHDRVNLIGLKAAHAVEEVGSSFRSLKAVVSEWIDR